MDTQLLRNRTIADDLLFPVRQLAYKSSPGLSTFGTVHHFKGSSLKLCLVLGRNLDYKLGSLLYFSNNIRRAE